MPLLQDKLNRLSPNFKATIVILWLAILSFTLPKEPVDPWGLISIQQITQLILVMVGIQSAGRAINGKIDAKAGSVLKGILGGIFSSMAVTMIIAKSSHQQSDDENRVAVLTIFGAIISQLSLALVLLLMSLSDHALEAFALFLPPILATAGLTLFRSQKVTFQFERPNTSDPIEDLLEIVKLSLVIVVLIAVSRVSQLLLGEQSLYALSFLVSLFELHGSLIANLQLHTSNSITVPTLQILLAIGILASLVSKLTICLFFGNSFLRRRTPLWFGIMMLASGLGFYLSRNLI